MYICANTSCKGYSDMVIYIETNTKGVNTMPLSESRRRANDKYISEHYSRIALSMPNEEAAALREYCTEHGLTISGFIRGLIKEAIGFPGQEE